MQLDACIFRRHAWTYVRIPIRPPKQDLQSDVTIGQFGREDLIGLKRVSFHAQCMQDAKAADF